MSILHGQCLCGAVNIELRAEPVAVRICWCRDCQHIAPNGSLSAIVPADALSVTGPLQQYVKVSDSGNTVTREFCSQCGSHIFARNSVRPGFKVLRTGNLYNPSALAPTANIWAGSAPEWACLDSRLERAERQP